MFGLIIAGRAVNISPALVGENKFLFAIDDALNVNHLTVFQLPGTPVIPNDYGAAIYLSWPPYSDWKILGYINNAKQSAIFRIGGSAHHL